MLRVFRPYSPLGTGIELTWMRNNPNDLRKFFTIDPAIGFRPILGNGYYSEYGTKVNDYKIEKRLGVRRLLFIGDSVTDRGRIVEGLKRAYGGEGFEFWNAGVESFNTVQEVDYYEKYNKMIRPDHVILTFHLNDFETTPIAFYDGNKLVVYAPDTRSEEMDPWWYRHSYVYRLLLAVKVAKERTGREAIARQVEEKLKELRDSLRADGIEFTVVILPYLMPYEDWTPYERACRARIIDIVERLDITHFDLLEPLNVAIKNGVSIQEREGDFWHPSEQVAELFAQYLHDRRIFSVTRGRA